MENNKSFNYFAYASNLKKSNLEQCVGSKIDNFLDGRLLDYGFRFNVKNADGKARANIIASESEDVFGAIYELENSVKEQLLKIYNFFYKDATIFLERKRNIFLNSMPSEAENK